MRIYLVAALAAVTLLTTSGCRTLDTAGQSAWAVMQPVATVLNKPSQWMAGTPREDPQELAYEQAYIERTRPGAGGVPMPLSQEEPIPGVETPAEQGIE